MWRLAPLIVLCTGCDTIFGLKPVDVPSDTGPPDAFVAPLDRELVAHYTLDAIVGGNTAPDSAGHHDALCVQNCPRPDDGHASNDGSLAFNESPMNVAMPEFLQIVAADDLELGPEYTVALWIRVDGLDGGCAIQQTYGSARDNAWQLCVDASGSLTFYSVENGVHEALTHVGNDAPTAMWTHVALVHTATQKIMYRNGIDIVDEDIGPASFSAGAATYIGADVDVGSQVMSPFEGAVDEVRIYARALAPEELQEILQADP